MSFLSRLFGRKKKEEPEPPRPAQPVQRETPKPAPPAPKLAPPPPPVQTPPKPAPDFATIKTSVPADLSSARPGTSTAPLGSSAETTAKAAPPSAATTQPFDPNINQMTVPLQSPFTPSPPSAPQGMASAPPAPPPPSPATAPLGGGDLGEGFLDDLDDLLGDFDSNFDAAIAGATGGGQSAPAGDASSHGVVVDQAPIRDLFADIAANYVRAVRNFMIEINRGDTVKEWIDICQPAVLSIKRAAEKMELQDVYRAVEDFDAILELASNSEGRMITGEIREELISTYDTLIELMPQAFTLDAERDQRESIIIHSLLMQVSDVRKVTVDKLYAAGLTTLEVFFLAKAEDLAATAGIPDWLGAKIVEKFQGYRAEIQSVAPDANRTAERAKLATLIGDLKAQQEGYERASNGWTEEAAEEKKRLRQARQDTLLQINVVLAQLGEVDLIHEIEKLPFERRIDRLASFLVEGGAENIPL